MFPVFALARARATAICPGAGSPFGIILTTWSGLGVCMTSPIRVIVSSRRSLTFILFQRAFSRPYSASSAFVRFSASPISRIMDEHCESSVQ